MRSHDGARGRRGEPHAPGAAVDERVEKRQSFPSMERKGNAGPLRRPMHSPVVHAPISCGKRSCRSMFRPANRLYATRGRAPVRGRCCPYGPCSTPCNRQGDHHAAQRERWLAGHNPNKSQGFPVKEPNGGRIPPDRSSLPAGKVCNASGSSNRVPGKTLDRQR